MENADIANVIGSVWDKKTIDRSKYRGNWWHSKKIFEHIGRKINGSFVAFIKHETKLRRFERGISVGCGTGTKELALLEAGIVERFDLFELSKERVAVGRKMAASKGLQDRMNFQVADAFARPWRSGAYDLVHWNNSLHHMMNSYEALQWSREVLQADGVMVMDDFVGPTRFQWSDLNLKVASDFRARLPKRLLARPSGDGFMPTTIVRKSIQRMIDLDPSEAADSGNILRNLRTVFPQSTIVETGGALYHLALAGVYANIDYSNEDDVRILDLALMLDDLMIKLGETHYAVAVAHK
jgi:SAM-dependent methyltransferase